MDPDPQQHDAAPLNEIPLDSILSEPLTHPLQHTVLAPPAQPPPLPSPESEPLTAGSVWRDGILDFSAAIGTTLVAAIVIMWSSGAFQAGRISMDLSPWSVAALFIATQIPIFLFARRRLKRNRQKGRPVPQLFAGEPTRAAAWGMAAGLTLALVSGIYTATLQKVAGEDAVPQQLEMLQDVTGDRLLLGLFVVIIAGMAPICEELLFRGAIFASAQAVGLPAAGATASALLFAIAHMSWNLAPFYALFALVMCWLYNRTESLVAPMAAHFTLNALACIALIVQGPSEVI